MPVLLTIIGCLAAVFVLPRVLFHADYWGFWKRFGFSLVLVWLWSGAMGLTGQIPDTGISGVAISGLFTLILGGLVWAFIGAASGPAGAAPQSIGGWTPGAPDGMNRDNQGRPSGHPNWGMGPDHY